jgi:uncharacterized membrane protein
VQDEAFGGGLEAAVLLQHAEQRRKSLENRVADQITRFAGSMTFV